MGLGEIGLSAQEHMVREAYALDRRRKENDAETERLRTETERMRGIVQRYQDGEPGGLRVLQGRHLRLPEAGDFSGGRYVDVGLG